MGLFSERVKRERNPAGIGHCDRCDSRLFREDNYREVAGKILCEDCVAELDEKK
ncbi:hypothetical protein HWB07_gp126 [Bacillus phage vB_BsuM-Goe3]|uniref:Uncharacterized protein n=1 Tax=Bacillus phage vB_BsuM-Goe3 TaxID=1933063 RepID=A0A217ERB7_BPGO3|nr:hypothetical protein HWB07_gp126 [Bacillus phage vB_BsuM-Goe3]APZ82644.1 hypothetical protein Goe3_c18300 [Bacillus phage vB_BsuM-Goe3]